MSDVEVGSESTKLVKLRAIRNKVISKSIARSEKDNSCDYEVLKKLKLLM